MEAQIKNKEELLEELGMTEEELVAELAANFETFDEAMKPSKKELVKLFLSGFVAGCSGTLVSTWISPLNITFNGPKAVDVVVNYVGKYGLVGLVTTRVMKDTKEGLDGLDDVASYLKLRRKVKKIMAKEQKAKKAKYIEAKED